MTGGICVLDAAGRSLSFVCLLCEDFLREPVPEGLEMRHELEPHLQGGAHHRYHVFATQPVAGSIGGEEQTKPGDSHSPSATPVSVQPNLRQEGFCCGLQNLFCVREQVLSGHMRSPQRHSLASARLRLVSLTN